MSEDRRVVAEVLAALTLGQRLARRRAEEAVGLAPDPMATEAQRDAATRESNRLALLEARLAELGSPELEEGVRPHFEAFFDRTVPEDWVEAQAFHYVGDALVSEFAEGLMSSLDPVSAEVVDRALRGREDQSAFALDQVTSAMASEPGVVERVAAYVRRVAGEALTQTRKALDDNETLREVLGGEEGQKRILLDLLDRHRRRLDRLGIEPVEEG